MAGRSSVGVRAQRVHGAHDDWRPELQPRHRHRIDHARRRFLLVHELRRDPALHPGLHGDQREPEGQRGVRQRPVVRRDLPGLRRGRLRGGRAGQARRNRLSVRVLHARLVHPAEGSPGDPGPRAGGCSGAGDERVLRRSREHGEGPERLRGPALRHLGNTLARRIQSRRDDGGPGLHAAERGARELLLRGEPGLHQRERHEHPGGDDLGALFESSIPARPSSSCPRRRTTR